MKLEFRIDMQFVLGAWAPNLDVIQSEPINTRRGLSGREPKDVVSVTGVMEFSLDNSLGNSAHVLGYYSPNSPNCRAGFGEGTPVRLVAIWNGADVPLWTGKLRVIDPTTGAFNDRRTRCLAHDAIADLAENNIIDVAPQVNRTEVQVLAAMIAALPEAARPVAVDYDVPLAVFPYALDDTVDGGTKGLGVFERIVSSVRGLGFIRADGTLQYRNASVRAVHTSQYTFSDSELRGVQVPSDLATVFNDVRITIHERTPTAAPIVLWEHTGSLALDPGESQSFEGTYYDPDRPELKIGGAEFVALDPGIDYVFNSDPGGLGVDVSSSVSVVATPLATRVKWTVTNNHATLPAYRIFLQIRGTGIYDLAPQTVEAYVPESYGRRPVELDWPYGADPVAAQNEADFIAATYRRRGDQVVSIAFRANNSTALMQQALTREIGDVISLAELVAVPTGASGYIQWIELEIGEDGILDVLFGLAPRIVDDEFLAGDTIEVEDDVDVDATSPPQFLIGTAIVGMSEVA